ncbi:MAG: FHA domain-containing protein [Arachnia propionica]|nr:MAG: FHA domain-containing protein [Arachnia propionica]
MSDLIVAAVKIAFLVLLWLFIFFVAETVRTDMAAPRKAKRRGKKNKAKVARLFTVIHGPQQGLAVPVAETIKLGRAADSTFLLEDDYSSVRHAQLVRQDDRTWILTDLNSTNGTFVNGQLVQAPTPVTTADFIRIGTTTMRLEP